MSGRVLSSSAIVDIATNRSVYGRAFLVAAVELGMTFPTPSTVRNDSGGSQSSWDAA